MPIYEYQCEACNHQLEALQKISDVPLVDCPQCGKPALKKKISAVGFRLKGGGWYETDFKTGGNKKNLAGEGAGGKPAERSSEGKASESPSAESKSSDSKAPQSKSSASTTSSGNGGAGSA